MTSLQDKELNWGRPYGRPFEPGLLVLEEWLQLYQYLPKLSAGGPDHYRVAVPSRMELHAYVDNGDERNATTEMHAVTFVKHQYYTPHRYGGHDRKFFWRAEGMSDEVLSQLRQAGTLNPVGGEY
jgi:hypothetical protein